MQNPFRARGLRPLALFVVIALAVSVVGGMAMSHAAASGAGSWHHDGMWSDGHVSDWGWAMMPFGLLWMALLVGLPAYLIYRLAVRDGDASNDPALELLREQYARGEIDDEEFERRCSHLESNR